MNMKESLKFKHLNKLRSEQISQIKQGKKLDVIKTINIDTECNGVQLAPILRGFKTQELLTITTDRSSTYHYQVGTGELNEILFRNTLVHRHYTFSPYLIDKIISDIHNVEDQCLLMSITAQARTNSCYSPNKNDKLYTEKHPSKFITDMINEANRPLFVILEIAGELRKDEEFKDDLIKQVSSLEYEIHYDTLSPLIMGGNINNNRDYVVLINNQISPIIKFSFDRIARYNQPIYSLEHYLQEKVEKRWYMSDKYYAHILKNGIKKFKGKFMDKGSDIVLIQTGNYKWNGGYTPVIYDKRAERYRLLNVFEMYALMGYPDEYAVWLEPIFDDDVLLHSATTSIYYPLIDKIIVELLMPIAKSSEFLISNNIKTFINDVENSIQFKNFQHKKQYMFPPDKYLKDSFYIEDYEKKFYKF